MHGAAGVLPEYPWLGWCHETRFPASAFNAQPLRDNLPLCLCSDLFCWEVSLEGKGSRLGSLEWQGRLLCTAFPGEKRGCEASWWAAVGQGLAAWVCCYSLQPFAVQRAEPLMLFGPHRRGGGAGFSCLLVQGRACWECSRGASPIHAERSLEPTVCV